MNYALRFHPAVRKDLRRISKSDRDKLVFSILPSFVENPYQGAMLEGPLRGYWKYRIFISHTWYRIGYVIDNNQREVVVLAIGPRGGFYERLRRRIKS